MKLSGAQILLECLRREGVEIIFGYPVTTIFLVLAIAGGILAGWLHFRIDYAGHTEVADTGRNRALASTPLLVVAVIMVVLELGSMVKATVGRYPVYTIGSANVAARRPPETSTTWCKSSARPSTWVSNTWIRAQITAGPRKRSERSSPGARRANK